MELIDNLNRSSWRTADPSKQEGYIQFHIFRYLPKGGPGHYNYAMFDDDGNLYKVDIRGGDEHRDPLSGIGNLACKISEDRHHILGIIVESECVVYTGSVIDNPDDISHC